MYENGTVSGKDEHCSYKYKTHVNIAFNEDPTYFMVDMETNTMVKYSNRPLLGDQAFISYDWEVLEMFFNHFVIVPKFINCYGERGSVPDPAEY